MIQGVRCPFCSGPVLPAPGGFLEIGEYDGKGYSVEGSVDGYQCQNGHGFYTWPGGRAVTAEDSQPPAHRELELKEKTMTQSALPILLVAIVARGGIIEQVSAHTGEQEATAALQAAVGGDFDPETDDARVFRIGPEGTEEIYSYQPEAG